MSELTKYIEDKLFSDESKDEVIKALNSAINIPIISEKTEEKILTALWSTVTDVLKNILRK
jgi:hypothetical protein